MMLTVLLVFLGIFSAFFVTLCYITYWLCRQLDMMDFRQAEYISDLTRKYSLLQELVMRYRIEATRGKPEDPLAEPEVPLDWIVGALESKALIQGLMEETHERLEPAVCEKCGEAVVMEELFLFTDKNGPLSVCESCLKELKEAKGEDDE